MILTKVKFQFRGMEGIIALDEYWLGGTKLLFTSTDGKILATLSVRIPGYQLQSRDWVFIKNYSELEGVLSELTNQGIVHGEDTLKWVRISPWVSVPRVRLCQAIREYLPSLGQHEEELE